MEHIADRTITHSVTVHRELIGQRTKALAGPVKRTVFLFLRALKQRLQIPFKGLLPLHHGFSSRAGSSDATFYWRREFHVRASKLVDTRSYGGPRKPGDAGDKGNATSSYDERLRCSPQTAAAFIHNGLQQLVSS